MSEFAAANVRPLIDKRRGAEIMTECSGSETVDGVFEDGVVDVYERVEYLYAELDRREAFGEPGDELIGRFLTAEVEGHRLSREDAIDIWPGSK